MGISKLISNKKYISKILIIVIGFINLFMYSNCFVRRPELTNRTIASATYFHNGTETSCLSCHSSSRPIGPVGPAYTFDHGPANFGGQGDCINCHSSQVTWSGGVFSHSPQPTTCMGCHITQRPTTLVGNPTFDHNINGKGDCYACHAASTTNYNVMSDWAGAAATPSMPIGNKNISITTGTPIWSNTTITSVTNSVKNFPLEMLHNSPQVPAVVISNCANCHSNSAAGNYTNGLFHSKITSATTLTGSPAGAIQPTACISCHVNAAPSGFVGNIIPGPAGSGTGGAGRSPASAQMRHDAVTWVANGSGVWSPTIIKIVTQDCTVCHSGVAPGAANAWTSTPGAAFHSKITSAGISQPSSCLDCHANNRPSGAAGPTGFLHTNAGGMGDCVTCHQSSVASNGYTSWINTGVFSHAGQTSCSSCHVGNRPTNTTGWAQNTWSAATTTFNLTTHASSTDCYSCHTASLTGGVFTSMANWQGGNYTHGSVGARPTSCLDCHTYPTATTPNLTGSGLSYQDHSSFGGQECAGCHTSPPNYTSISGWGGAAATPTGRVNGTGSVWNFWSVNVGTLNYMSGALSTATVTNTTQSFPQQMLHSSNQVPSSIANNCATCHTSGFSATSGTQFHTHVSKAQLTSCSNCHNGNAVPNGIVGPLGTVSATNKPNMHHFVSYAAGATIVGAQDCFACHKSTVGTSWKDGVFHPNTGGNTLTTCFACHIQRMPTGALAITPNPYNVDKFNHGSSKVTMDCIGCHSPSTVGPSGSWVTSTKIHSVIAATSFTECTSCHNSTPNPDPWGRHRKHNGYDCYYCHNNSLNAGSIGNNWIRSTSTGTSPCNQCH